MKKISNVLLTGIFLSLFSCSKEKLEENPPNFTTVDVLYTSAEGFEAGLNGLYSLVRNERNGLNYTTGFGTVDMLATIHLAGTDNIASGSNTGGISTIIADWSKNTAADPNIDKVFLWLYKVVSASNAIISRAENPSVKWTEQEKSRVLAEARTIRAWAYRHLTYLWGDVPLLTEEVSGENIRTDLTREKVAVIRRVMIEDFKFASEILPWLPARAGRMSRGVAQTYLAETYLAIGKPDSALIWTNECINNGPYKLITARYGASTEPGVAFMDMFNPSKTNISDGNTEALWVMQWERNAIGGGENLMRHESLMRYPNARYAGKAGFLTATDARGGRGWARQATTKQALLLYNSSSDVAAKKIDQRGSEFAIRKYYVVNDQDNITGTPNNTGTGKPWKVGDTVWVATGVKQNVIADAGTKSKSGAIDYNLLPASSVYSNDWPHSLKFAHNDPGFPNTTESHLDQIYMRLAETILLRAEAKGRLNDLPGAVSDLNMLRDRANAKRVAVADFGATLTSFLDYILDERSRELLLEEQRRYTLLRMGGKDFFFRRVSTWNTISKNLTLRDTLFAIPQSVIDANLTVKMPQNPGFN